jgi:ATP-binding cassette subfamily B protein
MLTWPVAVVGWVTSVVQQAEASQKRINAFLNEASEIKDGKGIAQPIAGAITFNRLSLTYPETKIDAVKQLSFTVEPKKTLGIIGGVGSGKSSILNLINRLYDPTGGSITLDEYDLKDFKLEELRSLIGYVPQNAFLFSESIEQNIKFGKLDATKEELIEAAKNGCVHENIIAFKEGYQTLLGERGITLSGGQIQRVAIARALIKDSKILLFDDCLSAVDTDTEEQILNNLKRICKNKTTIIVSHRISSVKDADTIMVMEKGALLESGTHNELMALKGYYFELFKKQQHEKEH